MIAPVNASHTRPVSSARPAFTLIELLVVVFILGLLIAILVPALSGARRAAKGASTASTLDAIQKALEAFKNDQGAEFPRSNGYPPSYLHPNINDANGNPVFTLRDGAAGKFPFIRNGKNFPRVYGAHFLPAMLLGMDSNGFVPRSSVPPALLATPEKWYQPDGEEKLLDRATPYLDPARVRLVATEDLPGRRPERNMYGDLFPDWSSMKRLPVIVDAFDYPILYYVPNRNGSLQNMMEWLYSGDNQYPDGPPIYYQIDNAGFTGTTSDPGPAGEGWDFGRGGYHKISRPGHKLTALDIDLPANRDTFARYVLDMNAFKALRNPTAKSPLRPVNKDAYVLVSTGPDALYGTEDDIVNFPRE